MKPPFFIIISGPSGVGKTTIAHALVEKLENLGISSKKIATFTTRAKRPGELDGIDYNFVDRKTFESMIENKELFEHTQYNDAFYGTPLFFKEELKNGISVIFVTDATVATHIKKEFPQAFLFWLLPPSIEILKERLKSRKTDSPEKQAERLKLAVQELEYEEKNKLFDHHLVNNTIEKTLDNLYQILKA